MIRIQRMVLALLMGGATCALAACETTSTGGGYHPANCAMVGSRCSSGR